MSEVQMSNYVCGAIMAIVSVVAVFGTVRALVLFARMKIVQKRRFSHISFLFINLIITDLVCGLFNASFMSYTLLDQSVEERSNTTLFRVICNVNGISDVFAPQGSVLINAIMSYGRYIAVCKSLRYNSLITTRKIYIAVGIAWVYSLYLAILPYMWSVSYKFHSSISLCSWYNNIMYKVDGKELQAFLFIAIVTLPSLVPACVVMVCCCLIIYQLVSAVSGSEQGVYGLSILFCRPSQTVRTGDLQFAKRMELIEAARSVLKIVLVFVFCNIAWWIKMLSDCLEFLSVLPFNWSKKLLGDVAVEMLNRVLKMLVISNSAITPFLYSFGNARRNASHSQRHIPITVSTQNQGRRSLRSRRPTNCQ